MAASSRSHRPRHQLLLNKCASNARKHQPSFRKIGSYRNSIFSNTKVPTASPTTPQVSRPLNSTAIAHRVYILALDDNDRVAIKEVIYVDLSTSWVGGRPRTAAAADRPFWVPDFVLTGDWSQDPPCYWTTKSVAMQDLEKSELVYNPVSDFSLEIIRWYRPDIFDVLFQRFCIRSKWSHSAEQLALLKDTIEPQYVSVDDFGANFSQSSPAAATLNGATLAADFLPVVDHYMALFSVRAFLLRGTLMLIR